MSQPTTIGPVANRRVVLALTTGAATRPVITIDGRDHPIAVGFDWNIFQQRRYMRLVQRIADFEALPDPAKGAEVTDADYDALEQAMLDAYGDMVAITLPTLPRATIAGLDLSQRQAIADVGNRALGEQRELAEIALGEANARLAADHEADSSPETPAAAAPPAPPLPQRGKPKRAKQRTTA